MNVGRIGATGATVQRIQFIKTRHFLVSYIFMGEIEAKRLEHLFFREVDGTLVELVSENKNWVRMIAIIFLNDAHNVRVEIIIRRLF